MCVYSLFKARDYLLICKLSSLQYQVGLGRLGVINGTHYYLALLALSQSEQLLASIHRPGSAGHSSPGHWAGQKEAMTQMGCE